jgi:hypothetical protein
MIFKRNRQYVAILVGGIPIHVDKVLELVADSKQHLNFVHGMSVFVLYFYSRKKLKELRQIFTINLRNEIDLIFIFPFHLKDAHFITPKVRAEMIAASSERENRMGSDLESLRNVITAHTARARIMQAIQQQQPIPPVAPVESVADDAPLSDQEIMGQLLDKMKATGYGSLSPAELDFLRTYTDKLNKNNNSKSQDNVD